jgi:MFS transporter, ACS family, D-galactonate transporter
MNIGDKLEPSTSRVYGEPRHTWLGNGRRYVVYISLFFLLIINYIDRINLSVAAGSIRLAYHLSPIELGYLFSAYSWTYALCLVPLGLAIDRWGIRYMVAAAMIVWSTGGMLTGVAFSFATLLVARLVLGAGEAAGLPAGSRVLREWAPRNERGLATGILNAGVYIGPALGAPLVGWLISDWGWRASFYVTGLIGIVFGVLWLVFYRLPERAQWICDGERRKILTERDYAVTITERPSSRMILKALLRSPTMWVLTVSHGCIGYTAFLLISWLPRYFEVYRGVDILKSSGLTAVPYFIAGILLVPISKLSDRLIAGTGLREGRRRNLVALNMLAASSILAIPYVSNISVILAIFSLSLTCVASALSLNTALANDLLRGSEASGAAIGFVLTGGNVFGITAPIVTGYIVAATNQFDVAFTIAGVLAAIGAIMNFMFTRRTIYIGPAQREVLELKSAE